MNVAPSFKSYEIIGSPFLKGNKQYVRARNPSSGKERDIRIYEPSEFRKLYPNSQSTSSCCDTLTKPFPMMKHARGFDKGPILVIRHDRPEDEPWLRASIARYAVGIGWYIASEDKFPDNAPKNFKYLLLSFDEFKNKDEYYAKTPEELEKILDNKARNKEWFNIDG